MCGKSMSNSKFLYVISPGGRERGLLFKKEGGARTFHGLKVGLVRPQKVNRGIFWGYLLAC